MDRNRENEQQIEGEEPAIAARARQHLAGGEPAAHRIEDGRDVHGDREGEHRGAETLGEEEARRSWRPSPCGERSASEGGEGVSVRAVEAPYPAPASLLATLPRKRGRD